MTRVKKNFTFAADGTTPPVGDKQNIGENGFIRMIIISTPNFTNGVTTEIIIRDKDGFILWNKSGIAKNLNGDNSVRVDDLSTPSLPHIPVDDRYTMEAIISGVAGVGGGTVSVMSYISRNKP